MNYINAIPISISTQYSKDILRISILNSGVLKRKSTKKIDLTSITVEHNLDVIYNVEINLQIAFH